MLTALLAKLKVEPRDYQKRIVEKTVAMFSGEHINRAGELEPAASSVMIESPTGSGKTVMGLLTAKCLADRFGLSVGWVAMRRNLLAQAQEENRRKGFKLDLKLVSMFDKNPPKCDLLIVDEAQHDGAQSMSDLHASVKPRMVLGLSATPYRSDRIKLCFDKVVADCGIHALIQDGYLSRYHHYTIPDYTPQGVAEAFAREPERWGKTLLFFHRHEQCIDCQTELLRRGHRAEIVTSVSDRDKQLDDFTSGRTNVLINMAILTEGFDCPTLKTVFCRPSGKGCTIQMGGRAFRKHAEVPFKQIVQCTKTKHPFMKTALPDEQYIWEAGGWKSLKVNKDIERICLNSLRLVAGSEVKLPALVAKSRERRPHWHRPGEGEP